MKNESIEEYTGQSGSSSNTMEIEGRIFTVSSINAIEIKEGRNHAIIGTVIAIISFALLLSSLYPVTNDGVFAMIVAVPIVIGFYVSNQLKVESGTTISSGGVEFPYETTSSEILEEYKSKLSKTQKIITYSEETKLSKITTAINPSNVDVSDSELDFFIPMLIVGLITMAIGFGLDLPFWGGYFVPFFILAWRLGTEELIILSNGHTITLTTSRADEISSAITDSIRDRHKLEEEIKEQFELDKKESESNAQEQAVEQQKLIAELRELKEQILNNNKKD